MTRAALERTQPVAGRALPVARELRDRARVLGAAVACSGTPSKFENSCVAARGGSRRKRHFRAAAVHGGCRAKVRCGWAVAVALALTAGERALPGPLRRR